MNLFSRINSFARSPKQQRNNDATRFGSDHPARQALRIEILERRRMLNGTGIQNEPSLVYGYNGQIAAEIGQPMPNEVGARSDEAGNPEPLAKAAQDQTARTGIADRAAVFDLGNELQFGRTASVVEPIEFHRELEPTIPEPDLEAHEFDDAGCDKASVDVIMAEHDDEEAAGSNWLEDELQEIPVSIGSHKPFDHFRFPPKPRSRSGWSVCSKGPTMTRPVSFGSHTARGWRRLPGNG